MNIGYPALPMDVKRAEGLLLGIYHLSYLKGVRNARIKNTIYYSDVYHEMTDKTRSDVIMPMDMPGWSSSLGWRSDFQIQYQRHHLMISPEIYSYVQKAEMTMYPSDSDSMYMMTWPDIGRNVFALGAHGKWMLDENWTLNASLRIEVLHSAFRSELGMAHWQVFYPEIYTSRSDGIKSIQTTLTRKIGSHNQLELLLGYRERFPTISEQFGFYLFNARDGFDYIGDPYLDPEQNLQLELSHLFQNKDLKLETSFFGHRLLSYYQAYIDSSYSTMTPGALGVKTYRSLSGGILAGIRFNADYQLNEKMEISDRLQYQYGARADGSAMPYINPFSNRLSNTSLLRKWKLRLEWEYSAPQNRYDALSGELPTKSFHLLNFGLFREWSIGGQKRALNIDIDNLTSTYYRRHMDWNDIPQAGGNLHIGLL